MGLGLSLPYLLISVRPELLKFLPRPGTWMNKLEIILGVILILTAVWILSILYKQLNTNSFIISFVLITSAFFALWVFHLSGRDSLKILSPLIGVLALFIIANSKPPSTNRNSNSELVNIESTGDKIIWQEFNPSLIPKIVKDGKAVFVDVTADWCLTCKINKNTLVSSKLVGAFLLDKNIIKMKADWTLPDPTISSFLEAHNRFGIPFNIVYGPGATGGVILPELLSESNILLGFRKALNP
jgi:suppressor for copper-sensitivity B